MWSWKVASKILWKVLNMARVGILDILWIVNDLGRNVIKWNVACGQRLDRFISSRIHTKNLAHTCFAGDKPDKCKIVMYVGAGFAGDLRDTKSISGASLFLASSNMLAL